MKFVDIDGERYSVTNMPERSKKIIQLNWSTQKEIGKLINEHAVVTRAKNAYIEDLKTEVIEAKSGLDMSKLFSEE